MSAVYKINTAIRFDVGVEWQTSLDAFLSPFTVQLVTFGNGNFLSRTVGPVPKEEDSAYVDLFFLADFPASSPTATPCLLKARINFELPLGDVHGGNRQRDIRLVPNTVWQGWVDGIDYWLTTTKSFTVIDGVASLLLP